VCEPAKIRKSSFSLGAVLGWEESCSINMATLLVVEDSRPLRVMMKRMFVEAGFDVIDVGDGEAALQSACDSKPDLIILDLLLPKMGGEVLLRALKQDSATAGIPVIVVSSLPQSNAERLQREGAIAYIEKSKLDLTTGGTNLVRLVNAALRKKPQPTS